MRTEDLAGALREAACRQPEVQERLDAVVTGGRRRRRRHQRVGATAVVAVLLAGAGAVVASDRGPAEVVVAAGGWSPSQAVDDGVPCPGSVTRREDGGRPGADGLPPAESASIDVDRARLVLAEAQDDLARAYGPIRIELGAGFGYAWIGESGGSYEVVEVDDYGILVGLADVTACPTGGGLHVQRDGVPLFFFVEPAEHRDPRALAPVRIERILVADAGPGAEEVTIVFDGPLAATEASRVDAAADARDRLAYRVQTASSVRVCGATHFFGAADEPGAVDVLLPGLWLEPDEDLSPPVEFVGSAAEHPGKVVVCGHGGVVQISIWGAALDGDRPLEVREVDGSTHLVVHVLR